MHFRLLSSVAFALLAAPGCAPSIGAVTTTGPAAVALTAGPGTSMVYLARTSQGVMVIDLGWWGRRSIGRSLQDLGVDPDSVTDVFLTHSHRDHTAAWPHFRSSRFHMAAAERALFTGEARHRGWVPALAERLRPTHLPRAGEVRLSVFSADTVFTFGADTLRAYLVPGHTAGSAVYLFRGVLFAGDAVTWSRFTGYGPAKRIYTDDRRQAVQSLEELWPRLPRGGVRLVCTAHARCTPFSAELLADIRSGWGLR